jgi:large subunit ribosomal protein L7/L12
MAAKYGKSRRARMAYSAPVQVSELRCTTCFAPLDASRGMVKCVYCGATLVVGAAGPRLLAAADLRVPGVPGWDVLWKHARIEMGPELVAQTPGDAGRYFNLLASQLALDDFRVTFGFRFLWGDTTTTRAGLLLRKSDSGFYAANVSTQGTLSLQYEPKEGKNVALVPWSNHHAIRTAPGDLNELSVELRGDRLRMEVNGAVVASLRDPHARQGRILAVCLSKVPMAIAVRKLEVYEPDGGADALAAAPPPVLQPGVARRVVLASAGANKIAVIKTVREATGLGLKEAKDLVDGAPCSIGTFPDGRAQAILRELRASGADARLE